MTNIAEILKDCPSGTKLYSPICGDCRLKEIEITSNFTVIHCIVEENCDISFDEYGRFEYDEGECLLFPSKENRDWSTFCYTKEFKKGDFLKDSIGNIFICNEIMQLSLNYIGNSFCVLFINGHCAISNWRWKDIIVDYANEEEKQKLIDAIGEKGYIWDTEKLKLRKKEPEFKPFDNVLVRDDIDDIWRLAQYGFESKDNPAYTYNTVGGNWWAYCISYEGNEHLLGTIENCE